MKKRLKNKKKIKQHETIHIFIKIIEIIIQQQTDEYIKKTISWQ
jgi:hypothetical protein